LSSKDTAYRRISTPHLRWTICARAGTRLWNSQNSGSCRPSPSRCAARGCPEFKRPSRGPRFSKRENGQRGRNEGDERWLGDLSDDPGSVLRVCSDVDQIDNVCYGKIPGAPDDPAITLSKATRKGELSLMETPFRFILHALSPIRKEKESKVTNSFAVALRPIWLDLFLGILRTGPGIRSI